MPINLDIEVDSVVTQHVELFRTGRMAISDIVKALHLPENSERGTWTAWMYFFLLRDFVNLLNIVEELVYCDDPDEQKWKIDALFKPRK